MGGTSTIVLLLDSLFLKAMINSSKHFHLIFKILLITQVFYLITTFFTPNIPSWRMFSKLERPIFSLTTPQGLVIDHKKYLANTSYNLSRETILNLSQFICLKSSNTQLILKLSDIKFYFNVPIIIINNI